MWRGPGGQPNALRAEQPNTLRAGRSCGGGQEGSQTHSELSSQTHSEPGGVVEGARRAVKRTESRKEWWRGPGGQLNALRAGRSGGGGQEGSQMH